MVRFLFLCAALASSSVGAAQEGTAHYLRRGVDSLYVEYAGSGPALLFLHDGLIHGVSWDGPFESLADSFHVVRFDRRGYGRPSPPTVRYSVVEDVVAVMDHLGLERATLVGASVGGAMAVDVALAHPERVDALVLVGSVVLGGGASPQYRERNLANSAALAKGDAEAALEAWLRDPTILALGSQAVREDLLRATRPYAEKHLTTSYNLILWHESRPIPRLGEIEAPTLVIVGEDDHPDVHAHAGDGFRVSERFPKVGARRQRYPLKVERPSA